MSILCPTCLTENGNDAQNCVICGSTLRPKSTRSTSIILCSACSTENDISAQFCVSCGLELKETLPTSLYLPSGTLLKNGAYQLEKVVGEGGFGITYRASAVNTGELLAIKELLPERSARQGNSLIWMFSISPAEKREQINKFKNEAETLSQCVHRNIVRVYEAFEENNTAYIVMNFVTGKTLEAIFKQQGRLAENTLKSYFRQIGEALRIVHVNYTLHRDIKPGNIIIDDTDNAILVDFGSAREFIADKTGRMTRILSPGYAPPEQYSSSGRFTPSTDIYALCASLYELLTGELPVSALDRLQEDTLKSPRLIVPEISQLMEQIILTGMRLRVEDRFQSADELINAFDGKYISPSLGRSRSLAKENHLPEAVQAYRTVLKVEPDNGDAAVELAMIQMYLDDVDAEAAAQVAIRLRPQDSRGYGVLGLVACRQGKWVEATRHLQLAVTFSPQTAWIYSNLAWALGKTSKWQKAEVYLSRALQLGAESPFTLGLQAWLAAQQKNWKIAIRTASRSIINAKQLSPAQSPILLQWLYPCKILALIESVENPQAEDIERAIQRFIEDCPDIAYSWGFKGWWWSTKERWRDALASFEMASCYFPVPEWILLNQGIVEERLGNLQSAIQVYETYLQQFQPSLSLPLLRIGTLYGQMGQWEKARSYLERAAREQPDNAEAYHNLGWVLLNIKTSEGAIENVREVRRVYQKAVELYFQQDCTTLSDQIRSAFRDAEIEL